MMPVEPTKDPKNQKGLNEENQVDKKGLHTDEPLSEKDEVKKAERKTQGSARGNG